MNCMGHNSRAFGEAMKFDLEAMLGSDDAVQFRHIDWHIGDWMGGTIGMSCEHEGAYCRFLNRLYQRGKPLPDDDRFMSVVMGLSVRVWRRLRDVLVEAGKIMVRAGCLTNARFEKERMKQAERLRQAAAAARARWSNSASLDEVSPKFAPSLVETPAKLQRKTRKKVNEIKEASDAVAMPYQSQSHTPIKDSPNGELSPTPSDDLFPDPPAEAPPMRRMMTATDAAKEGFRMWNELAERCGLPKAEKLTDKRMRALGTRMRDAGSVQRFGEIIAKIEHIGWMCGDNDRGWRADLDFVCQQSSFVKLMEGAYERGEKFSAQPPRAPARRTQEEADADYLDRLARKYLTEAA